MTLNAEMAEARQGSLYEHIAEMRRVADAAEQEYRALGAWMHRRGTPGRENLERRSCTGERRELVQAHQDLGRRHYVTPTDAEFNRVTKAA